jgi:HK97 family phage major capsid protein
MMHDNVLAALKKLALGSSDATPLWQRSMREGEPDTIEGFRYWINQGMASTLATTNKVMLFGDFSQYVIRIVKNLELARLNELYAGNGQVGFYGFIRLDGECMNTAAIKHYVML